MTVLGRKLMVDGMLDAIGSPLFPPKWARPVPPHNDPISFIFYHTISLLPLIALFRRGPCDESDGLRKARRCAPRPRCGSQVAPPQVICERGVPIGQFRWCFVSVLCVCLVQAGRQLQEVTALAGHRDIKMTLRYAHLAPSHLRALIQALEERNRYLAGPWLSTEPRVTPVSQDFGGSA